MVQNKRLYLGSGILELDKILAETTRYQGALAGDGGVVGS